VHRSRFSKALICSLLFLTLGVSSHSQSSAQQIVLDASAPATPFPHFWEQMFGSGRAVLALRDNYRKDLREVRQATDFRYVRFHGIFHDEVGVYSEDEHGQPVYNFSYIDQIYDGLLADGAKPFVELSFMPNALAARNMPHAFWYKPNISPPKDWGKWDALITQFAKHIIQRYGIDEVGKWYFEVWNEPNLDFWGGDPKQSTYWELYDHTAKALKAVDTHLRVGGPSTAQAGWADAFIAHCSKNQVPVDFVSSHVYGNDKAEDVFGTHEEIPRNQMVCRAVRKVHDQIKASPMPQLPLIWTEFNASYMNEPDVTDSTYMGPWMADTIRQCDGLVDMMSYWTFSDVFEEQGVVKIPFYGGFGLIAVDDIPKPAFAAFKLLHELGDQRIAVDSDSALLTKRRDGTLVLAVWNYAPPNSKEGPPGSSKTVTLEFKGARAKQAMISRVDGDHGDVRPLYEKMGSPRYPTSKQIEDLRHAATLPVPEKRALKNGTLTLTLPAQGLAVIELK
jgi:xylan 1,4-beta-xylosidase